MSKGNTKPITLAQHEAARAARRKAALQTVARSSTSQSKDAKRILAEQEAASRQKAAAAAPKSIKDAGGDARAFARADMERRAAKTDKRASQAR